MQRLQAYTFALLNPTGADERAMRRSCGSRRFVFNKGLALQKERHAAGLKHLYYADLCKHLTAWKADPATTWLMVADSQVLQQSLKDLCRAYDNFFKGRAEVPRFKRKGHHESFRYPQRFKLDQANGRIFLPKIGWLRYRASRPVEGDISQVTVSHRVDRWFVAIQTERAAERPAHPSTSMVAIDLGVARFVTLSDGSFVEPVNAFRRSEAQLAKAQRRMSRKIKHSSNWKKAKVKVQSIQARIARIRQDFLHQTSTQISKSHAIVCVEDLKVRNMTASAAGTVEHPGTNVRAKAGLDKAILDQGWGMFVRQLGYKLEWRGGMLVEVDPRNTSHRCPECGHVAAENRRSQARFACVSCGHEAHADHVGAINVLTAGHARLACGETSSEGASAQEPTEARSRLAA
ncbi:RNA-guided endonuclease TnpB family protein [Microvirga sp. VF16]|uniref:RNA-guided endonuclease InsQ/TnpB family protein n=1 Tax=Microvirga sp. VF16 TaxID=2807101 RepID=UPI00193CA095|nr:RNA-guided endonuclease TnpB family protein [Microvirga sp. VF16]QRM33367.1 transposase [Microvirga sp. VF16]